MTPSTSSRDLRPELGAQLVELGLGVLDDVVQERGRDRLLVEVELGADPRDAPRVVDELLAGAAHLAAVAALGDLERAADQVPVDVRVVGLDAREQLLDEVLVVPLGVDDRHGLSVRARPAEVPPFARRRRSAAPARIGCEPCASCSRLPRAAAAPSADDAAPRLRRPRRCTPLSARLRDGAATGARSLRDRA